MEGPGLIKDKVWYNAYLTGTELVAIWPNGSHGNDQCCYIIPGTDKENLARIYLYLGKEFVSNSSGAYCGYGGTYGKLVMHVIDADKTIKAY